MGFEPTIKVLQTQVLATSLRYHTVLIIGPRGYHGKIYGNDFHLLEENKIALSFRPYPAATRQERYTKR